MIRLLSFTGLLCLLVAGATATQPDMRGPQERVLDQIGFDQKLGADLPLELSFRNEQGETVRLGDYFKDQPVVLALVYYECPMLCTMVMNGITRSLRVLSLDAGKDFQVVTVSIDPKETPELAATKKQHYLDAYRREGAENGWHLLTGDDANIKQLAEAVGFRYTYDPATKQYAHAAGIMVATPKGRLSHYFYGVEYVTRDLRLALVEASSGKLGSPVDQVLLYCYHYDPLTGTYGVMTLRLIRILGIATVVILVGGIGLSLRNERKRNKQFTNEAKV